MSDPNIGLKAKEKRLRFDLMWVYERREELMPVRTGLQKFTWAKIRAEWERYTFIWEKLCK